jgi:hypothetical protein
MATCVPGGEPNRVLALQGDAAPAASKHWACMVTLSDNPAGGMTQPCSVHFCRVCHQDTNPLAVNARPSDVHHPSSSLHRGLRARRQNESGHLGPFVNLHRRHRTPRTAVTQFHHRAQPIARAHCDALPEEPLALHRGPKCDDEEAVDDLSETVGGSHSMSTRAGYEHYSWHLLTTKHTSDFLLSPACVRGQGDRVRSRNAPSSLSRSRVTSVLLCYGLGLVLP